MKNEKTREQVMQGLELHAHCAHECDKCPYDDQRRRWMRGEGASCDSFLAADALRLVDEMDVTIRALMGEFGDSCDADGCGGGGATEGSASDGDLFRHRAEAGG